jgi:hypothetical protein
VIGYVARKIIWITRCNLSNIRYAESSSEENGTDDSDGDNDSDAEKREPEGKTASKLFMSKDAEGGILIPESQASKMDVTGDISTMYLLLTPWVTMNCWTFVLASTCDNVK